MFICSNIHGSYAKRLRKISSQVSFISEEKKNNQIPETNIPLSFTEIFIIISHINTIHIHSKETI